MSNEPTSGLEDLPLPALLQAGWKPEEYLWEHKQEQAAQSVSDGDDANASKLWAEALALARETFSEIDPRLATSLANHARALKRKGKDASALLEEALRVWDSSEAWVSSLRPERRSRSSLYHFRLETRYPGQYDRFSKERYLALASEGRAAVHANWSGTPTSKENAQERLARWHSERPAGFNDLRKLLAAVFLVA